MIRVATLWTAALLLAAGTAACGGDGGNGALSLDEYLILTLGLQADQSRSGAAWWEELAELSDDPDAYFEYSMERQDWGEMYAQWAYALAKVTPPSEAETYHATLLDLLPELEKYSDGLAAAEDPDERSELRLLLVDLWSDHAEAWLGIYGLVVPALETRAEDPLNAYLVSATEIRLEFARETGAIGMEQQELLYAGALDEDVDALLASHEAYLSALEDYEGRWQALTAPSEAEELHQRQAELTAHMIAAEELLLGTQDDPDENSAVPELGAFAETIARSRALDADWNELLIEALSR